MAHWDDAGLSSGDARAAMLYPISHILYEGAQALLGEREAYRLGLRLAPTYWICPAKDQACARDAARTPVQCTCSARSSNPCRTVLIS